MRTITDFSTKALTTIQNIITWLNIHERAVDMRQFSAPTSCCRNIALTFQALRTWPVGNTCIASQGMLSFSYSPVSNTCEMEDMIAASTFPHFFFLRLARSNLMMTYRAVIPRASQYVLISNRLGVDLLAVFDFFDLWMFVCSSIQCRRLRAT